MSPPTGGKRKGSASQNQTRMKKKRSQRRWDGNNVNKSIPGRARELLENYVLRLESQQNHLEEEKKELDRRIRPEGQTVPN